MLQVGDGNGSGGRRKSTAGKRVFIPPMAYGQRPDLGRGISTRWVSEPTSRRPPITDSRVGRALHFGDECIPAKVTVGDFHEVLEQPASTGEGGAVHATATGRAASASTRRICGAFWKKNGYPHTSVISPSRPRRLCGFWRLARAFVRTAWRALIAAVSCRNAAAAPSA